MLHYLPTEMVLNNVLQKLFKWNVESKIVNMMGQINTAGFQSPAFMFHVYVIVEIKYFWLDLNIWIPQMMNRIDQQSFYV